ncbi:MAG TPA: O-antigen ligase family protein, partial [Candidatus Methanoperedens sp.]|nr:O-antigen ligase family protein [Candidatus Methanoperedens sp.]
AAVYFLAVLLLARQERLRAISATLAVFAAALAFTAILQRLVSPQLLLFVREAPSPHPFGPFVNRNHYANLMAMLGPVLVGLSLGSGTRSHALTARGRLADLLARRASVVRLLYGLAALLALSSLVLSLSRGGIVAAAAGLLAFGSCLAAHRLARRGILAAALFVPAVALFVGWFGWAEVTERFAVLRANPEVVDTVRAGLWRDTLRLATDFPALGAGVGSFERLYPAYRTVPGPLAIAHPHNDHLELLAGGGGAGVALFAWFVAATLSATARACRGRRDPAALTLACGATGGCVAFLVHGASDFPLAIDANALWFFFLLGLAVSASHTRQRPHAPETLLPPRRLPAAAAHATALAALAAVVFHAADIAARAAWRQAGRVPPHGQTAPAAADVRGSLARAAQLQPLEALYPAALARLATSAGEVDQALRLTRRALRLLPADAAALAQLAALLAARGDDDAARRLFAAAVAADTIAARHAEAFGAWLLSRGERAAGAARLREAMAREPPRTSALIGLLVLAGFDDRQIAAVVPPAPEALRRLRRYLEATGR